MLTRDFTYQLPDDLIARYPTEDRDGSRLLRLDDDGTVHDSQFKQLSEFLRPGDLLVLNNTRVIPARLFAQKETGGKVEIMLERIMDDSHFLALLRVSKPPKVNSKLILDHGHQFEVIGREDDLFHLRYIGKETVLEIAERLGHIPLPPYIDREDDNIDRDRYQTVFAKNLGAVAAPTASLHFTNELLEKLKAQKIEHVELTLHVGAGTFQPVRVDDISQHHMHSEYMQLSDETVKKIESTRDNGGKIVAVGTTVVRSLETAAQNGKLKSYKGETDIFIYPGFRFNVVDMLITNFHLPESTLLMLVCAFAGKENILRVYQHAIEKKYRFFSYGDAMLLSCLDKASDS